MKERDLYNQEWVKRRDLNREMNVALRDGFFHGQVFRRNVMARLIVRSFLQRESRDGHD